MKTKSVQGLSFPALLEMKSVGFTLVELLIVITIVGILAGVLTTIINPVQQRKNAEDGIRRSNMNKLVMGIESYKAGEGSYPTEAEKADTTSKLYQIYLKAWPTEPAGSTYSYSQSGENFGLIVAKAATPGYIKYRSEWGKMDDCTNSDPASTSCAAAAGPTYSVVQCNSSTATNCTNYCAGIGKTCGNNCSDTVGVGCTGNTLGYMYSSAVGTPVCTSCTGGSWGPGICTAGPPFGRVYCCCSN